MTVSQDAFGPRSGGLDRNSLNVYTSVETKDRDADTPSSPVANIRRLSRRVRSKFHKKTNEALISSTVQRETNVTTMAPILAPTPPATTQEDRFSDPPPDKPSLPPLKEFVKSPLQTAKAIVHTQGGNDFADNLAKADVSHEASVKLVRAYDRVAEAETNSDEELALEELELLKSARQDSFVRWTLDRHIRRVGRIQAHRLPTKKRTDFVVVDEQGKAVMQWSSYGKHVRLCTYY